MGTYRRGKTIWLRYAGPSGEKVRESTGQGDQRVADRMLTERKRAVANGTWTPATKSERLTLSSYAEQWIARRHEAGVRTAHDEEVRLRTYVLPALGSKPLGAIKRAEVAAVIAKVQRLTSESTGKLLAPRTVHHVYGALRTLYADALVDELVLATPCTLRVRRGELPKKRDADPMWRATALFSRDEVERILSSPSELVPDDRRTLYAIEILCGLRFGEAAGRRWRDYDPSKRPLGSLHVHSQYVDRPLKGEGRPRMIPVHPVLAAMLAEWRLRGFPELMGRAPKPEDWIVPSRRGLCRSVRHGHNKMQEDLERLGLRRRRQHDSRRTMITLCRADGARDEVLRAISHGPPDGSGRDAYEGYTTWPWATLCEAMSCLKVSRRKGTAGAQSTSKARNPRRK